MLLPFAPFFGGSLLTTPSHVIISNSGHSLHPAPISNTAKPMAVDDLATTVLAMTVSALHQVQEQSRTARTMAEWSLVLGAFDDATDWSEHEGVDALCVKRSRRVKERKDWRTSAWWIQLQDADLLDYATEAAKVVRGRLRVPHPFFLELVKLAREKKWFSQGEKDATGRDGIPVELKSKTEATQLSTERDVFGRGKLFSGTVQLSCGRHRFRFLVDGEWRHDPQLLYEQDGETGELCNVVDVMEDSSFRLQMPAKALPDKSAEAADYINSLKEYGLRTSTLPPPPEHSEECRGQGDGGEANEGPGDGVGSRSERTNEKDAHVDGGCSSTINSASGGAGTSAVTAGVSVSGVDAESRREFGVDLRALGIQDDAGGDSIGSSGGRESDVSTLASAAEARERERVVPAASATYRRREASVAAVGACLVSSSVRKDGKLLVAMVGLPARGKSFVARSIARHLDWVGFRCRIFSQGQRRRKEVGVFQPAAYFDQGGEGEKTRMRIAGEVLGEALEALKDDIDIAVLDASNITKERRRWLADAVASSGLHCQVIFIESICHDQDLVLRNIMAVRESSPEYHDLSPEESERDFRARIKIYERLYQPLETNEGYGFIKLIDVGSQMVTNLIGGYIPGRITLLCLNLHLKPRPIWMSRHGESEFNKQSRIGGDAPLTAEGRVYADKLAAFMDNMYPPSQGGEGVSLNNGTEELVVWTSTMVRTGETVAPMTAQREVVKWSQLREIDAGLMDSLTYEYVAAEMPDEYEARKKDKLRYRYPEGESYQDLFARLEPVLLEMMRQRSPLLVVGHQAILRVLYGYLTGKAPEECPTLHMPLHTVIKLTPKAYTCEEEWHLPLQMEG